MSSIYTQQGSVGFLPLTLQNGKQSLLQGGQTLNVSTGIASGDDLSISAAANKAINVYSPIKGYDAAVNGTLKVLFDQLNGAVQATGSVSVKDAISGGTDLGLLEVLSSGGAATGAQLTVKSAASASVKAVLSASSTAAALNMFDASGNQTVNIANDGTFTLGASSGGGSSSATFSDTALTITTASASFDFNSAGDGKVQLNGGKFYVDASHLSAVANNELITKKYADDQVSAEASRAVAAEGSLTTRLSSEESRAAAAEGSLASDLSSEVSRATAAEGSVALAASTAVSAEASRAVAAESSLASGLSSETSRALAAEGSLETLVNNLSMADYTAISTDMSVLQSDLSSETSRATAAEGSVALAASSAISAEASRAVAAEGSLASDLASEASRAVAAEDSVALAASTAVSAEASRATAAEGSLANDLSSETSRALAAEGSLASDLSSEASRATAAEGSVAAAASSALSSEVSRATAAEGSLASDLSSEASRALAAEGSVAAAASAAVSVEASRATAAEGSLANDLSSEIARANSAEGSLAHDISAEAARAQSAEGSLASDLSSEVLRAESAESSLQGYVDLKVQGYSPKVPVDLATTGNVDLTSPWGAGMIDGVAPSSINAPNGTLRILVRAQTNAAENGIYDLTVGPGGSWVRAGDANSGDKLQRALVTVEYGTQYIGNTFFLPADSSLTLIGPSPSAINWYKITAPGDLVAGNGIDKSGNTVSMKIEVETDTSGTNYKTIDFNAGGYAFVNSLLAGFKVNNVATSSAYVTAANLDRLVNGSNVDVDASNVNGHMHARLTAGVSVSGVTEGYLAYMTGDSVAGNADISSSSASSVVGIRFQGKLVTSGAVPAVVDAAGGAPVAGDQLYLAAGGKVSKSAPASGYRAPVGFVVDASQYAGNGTVVLNFAPTESMAL